MDASTHPAPAEAQRHIAVVGGGPAAHRLTEALISRDPAGLRISVFTEESSAPYDRVALSRRFAQVDDELLLGDPALWEDPRVQLHTGTAVTALDVESKTLRTAHGEVLGFDELVLATGSSAPRPPIEGSEHIAVYRTLEDVDWLRRRAAELGGSWDARPAAR